MAKQKPPETDVPSQEKKAVDKSKGPVVGDMIPSGGKQPNPIDQLYTGEFEETWFRSPMVSDSYKPPYNRDDLWQKYGDYRVYEEMGQDDQVAVCLRLKKDLILGSGFYFKSLEDGQDDMVSDLMYLFEETPEASIEDMCEEILTATEFGFSLSEKVFKTVEENKLTIKKLLTRHPNSWKIYQDEKGNITKFTQMAEKQELEINPKSLIHFINQPRFQNPYGTSDLRAAFNAYFVKRQVIRYYAIFLEKAASPTPIARYDKNAPKKAIDDIYAAIQKLQAKTAMAIPKDIEMEYLESKSTGEAYEKAINIFNMFIARALFVPDLIGLSGAETGGGSYSLGKEQMRIFFMHIGRSRKQLEKIINKNFVEPMVYWNYGFVKNYPKFKFKPIDTTEATELAKLWTEAVKGKLYKPNEEEINYFRKLVNFPEGDVEFYGETAPQQFDEKGNPIPPQNNDPNNPFGGKQNADGKPEPDDAAPENPPPDKKNPLPNEKPADKKDAKIVVKEKKDFGKVYNLPPGDYCKKVNFKAIETKLNDYDTSLMNDVAPIVKKAFADLETQLEQKRIIQSGNPDKMDTLKLKYMPELRRAFEKSFQLLYKDAQSQAATELNKANYKLPTTAPEFNNIVQNEVYKYVGDYEYKILSLTKTALIAAMKDGAPLSTVTTILNTDGSALSDQSLERFSRTKHTEILNRARVDYFDNSGVVSAYQYSAILDDKTTDICAGLDGKIFENGDQPVPPLHFNCRSTLVPITKYEEYKPTTSIKGMDPQDFIEENKGDGFSTQ